MRRSQTRLVRIRSVELPADLSPRHSSGTRERVPTARRYWTGAVCAGVLVAAQITIRLQRHWALASIALVGAACALALLLRPARAPDPPPPAIRTAGSRSIFLIGGMLALAGALVAVLASHQLVEQWRRSFDYAAPLLVAGTALWSLGLAIADRRQEPFTIGRDPMPSWERLALAGIVVLSFGLRFYRYGDFPPPSGICAIEEAQAGQSGWHILSGARPWEYLLDNWLAAAGIWIGGTHLTSIRVPFTIFSALTVVPLYFLLRCLVSRTVSLAVALLFVVCHWHLVYARYAHNIFLTTFFVVVILYLLIRARLDDRLAFYPWIGLLSGYTLYAYSGYRATPLFAGLFLGGVLLADFRQVRRLLAPSRLRLARHRLQRQLLASLLALAAFTITVLPLVRSVAESPRGSGYYLEGVQRTLANRQYYTPDLDEFARLRLLRLRDAAMIFNHAGDPWVTMNLPSAPMLDPAVGLLLVVAVFYCMACPRVRYQGFFAALFLVLLLVGTVFVQNLDVRRLQGIIPVIFVLVALLLERISQWLAPLRRTGRGLFLALLAAITVVAYVRNLHVYFVQMMNSPVVRGGFHNPYTIALDYLRSLPSGAHLLLLAHIDNFFLPSDYEWLRGTRVQGRTTSDLHRLLAGQPAFWRGKPLFVLMKEPYAIDDLPAFLVEQFPGTRCEPVDAPDDPSRHPRFLGCEIPSEVEPSWPGRGGLLARYFRGGAPAPFLERVEPFVSFELVPDQCNVDAGPQVPPCRVNWRGKWTVAEETRILVEVQLRRAQAIIELDGAPVRNLLQLSPGEHSFEIRAELQPRDYPGVRVRWRSQRPDESDLLPFYRLVRPARD
jgi:hypothetical protein